MMDSIMVLVRAALFAFMLWSIQFSAFAFVARAVADEKSRGDWRSCLVPAIAITAFMLSVGMFG